MCLVTDSHTARSGSCDERVSPSWTESGEGMFLKVNGGLSTRRRGMDAGWTEAKNWGVPSRLQSRRPPFHPASLSRVNLIKAAMVKLFLHSSTSSGSLLLTDIMIICTVWHVKTSAIWHWSFPIRGIGEGTVLRIQGRDGKAQSWPLGVGTQVWIPETSIIPLKLLSPRSPTWTSKSKSSGYFSILILLNYSVALSTVTAPSFLKYLLCRKFWGRPAYLPLILSRCCFLLAFSGSRSSSDFIFYTHSRHHWLQIQPPFSPSPYQNSKFGRRVLLERMNPFPLTMGKS